MNKPAHAVREPACEIRFSQVGIAQLRIRTLDVNALHADLEERLKTAPQLFERSGVCIDFGGLEVVPEADKARALIEAVRWAGMLPVGVAKGADELETLARALDLPLLAPTRVPKQATNASKAAREAGAAQGGEAAVSPYTPVQATAPRTMPPQTTAPQAAAPAAPAAPALTEPTLIHQQPVRSGQRVYAKGRDLIVTSAIGAGAEVMADGCVHAYGVLRGRALAGARGDTSARVFCQEFHAELVSIAGVFRVFESLPAELAGKPVQAWLQGDDLCFAPIGT